MIAVVEPNKTYVLAGQIVVVNEITSIHVNFTGFAILEGGRLGKGVEDRMRVLDFLSSAEKVLL